MTMLHEVASDLDVVIYPFPEQFTEVAQQRLRRELVPDYRQWRFWAHWGIDQDTFHDIYLHGLSNGRLFGEGQPVPGSVEALQRVADHGGAVHIITARSLPGWEAQIREATSSWLHDYGVPHHHLTVCDDVVAKTSVVSGVPVAAIDDLPAHVDAWRDAGTPAALYDHPHNRSAGDPHRVVGWEQAGQFLIHHLDLATVA